MDNIPRGRPGLDQVSVRKTVLVFSGKSCRTNQVSLPFLVLEGYLSPSPRTLPNGGDTCLSLTLFPSSGKTS